MNKGLAFLVFLSAAIAAFCLSLLCYTLVTGDLPFHLTPLTGPAMKKVFSKEPTTAKNAPPPVEQAKERIGEEYILAYYKEMLNEREKLAREKEKLAEKERNLSEIMLQAKLMQEKIGESEKKLRQLLDFIDNKQQENLRRTAKMISGMDIASAGKMLMEWDEKKAAQVMYFVNDKVSSKIIGSLLESRDKQTLQKTKQLVQLMEKVSEDPKDNKDGQ